MLQKQSFYFGTRPVKCVFVYVFKKLLCRLLEFRNVTVRDLTQLLDFRHLETQRRILLVKQNKRKSLRSFSISRLYCSNLATISTLIKIDGSVDRFGPPGMSLQSSDERFKNDFITARIPVSLLIPWNVFLTFKTLLGLIE